MVIRGNYMTEADLMYGFKDDRIESLTRPMLSTHRLVLASRVVDRPNIGTIYI
eukprot:SAG31_NODE_4169_length_3511_cov_7.390680_3_plen_53_part_00